MPNISLYLNDAEYFDFRQLPEELQREARDSATKQILKVIKKGGVDEKNNIGN